MNNTKKKSPISWVPTAYFAMGLPFVVQYGYRVNV